MEHLNLLFITTSWDTLSSIYTTDREKRCRGMAASQPGHKLLTTQDKTLVYSFKADRTGTKLSAQPDQPVGLQRFRARWPTRCHGEDEVYRQLIWRHHNTVRSAFTSVWFVVSTRVNVLGLASWLQKKFEHASFACDLIFLTLLYFKQLPLQCKSSTSLIRFHFIQCLRPYLHIVPDARSHTRCEKATGTACCIAE